MQRGASFGDLLVQAPFLHGLKTSLGAQRVVVIAPHPFVELLGELGLADTVHIVEDAGTARIKAILREERPRWAISLRGSSLRSSWLLRGCRGAQRAGWRSGFNRLLLDVTVPKLLDDYYALVFGRLLEAMGGVVDIAATGAAIACPDPDDALPAPGAPRLLCMPAGKVAAKQWGVPNYLALGDTLSQRWSSLQKMVVLGPREADLAAAFTAAGWIARIAPAPRRLAALCHDAICIVANDCGPGHLAQMTGQPMVILFHNENDRDRRERLLRLWWWRRAHSRAISTAEPGPIEAVPPDYVAEQAMAAVSDAAIPADPLWYSP